MTQRDTTGWGHRPWFLLIALFAMLALVGACGGDDDDTDAFDDTSVSDDDADATDDDSAGAGTNADTGDTGDDTGDDAAAVGDDPGGDAAASSEGGGAADICGEFESYMENAFGMIDAALSGDPAELERVSNLIRADLMNIRMSVPDEIRDEFQMTAEHVVAQLDALEDAEYSAEASGEIFRSDAASPEVDAAEEVLNTYVAAECGLTMGEP